MTASLGCAVYPTASKIGHMLSITERAQDKIRALKEGDAKLRIAVVGGGCSGLSYKLSWETSDEVSSLSFEGFSVLVDAKSALFIKGLELDYTDGLDGQGFQFNNPNAKRSCGCGSSFSL